MYLLAFLAVSFLILLTAYLMIGPWLARTFVLDHRQITPAHTLRDGHDFEPATTSYLLPQHFSAIAAAGPIVGPILAGLYFGWGPTWLWIILGSIFIGGIHDFTALIASVRHGSKSVAEVVKQYMNPRAYVLFLIFIWSALIYVIVAFTDVTAQAFVAKPNAVVGEASGPSVATSSMLYLLLAVAMGFMLRFTGISRVAAKVIFLPLVFGAVLVGPMFPLDLGNVVPADEVGRMWGYLLLAYCFIAAMSPMWSLLQPRGELGGYFLYIVMIVAVLGIGLGAMTGAAQIQYPMFKGFHSPDPLMGTVSLFPILFITVACGACSGFHSIVASGTTSKQLDREIDAKPIAYGGMLLEGFLACLSLATVMVLAGSTDLKSPNAIYANGIAKFGLFILKPLGYEGTQAFALLYQFALLCFATFVFDTLDACTRLSRYIFMELMGWTTRAQAFAATAISLTIPVIAISLGKVTLAGKELPLWQVFWNIFGSSNQLLAALTLLAMTVWLARKRLPVWLTLWPTVFMVAMTLWSLVLQIKPYLALLKSNQQIELIRHFQFGIIVSLILMSIWLIIEAIITWRSMSKPPADEEGPAPAQAEALAA